ncbi:MAG: HEPN domain-containing protein [Caldilineaceae bacterium]
MNDLIAEWLSKAEDDFATSERELRARKRPNYDGACFHAQQMAEKYLKGLLQKHEILFPKTHNLVALLELCLPVESSLELQIAQI